MSSSSFPASLNLGTLVIVVVIVGIVFAYFLRRRSNRHPMENQPDRNVGKDIDEARRIDDRPQR